MLRKITLLSSLALVFIMTIGATASAQDATDTATPPFDGLESCYTRMFMPDLAVMIKAASAPGAEVLAIDADDVLAIRNDISTFDDTGNAENGMDMIADEV